jgi:2-hydroxychromene-2-carboxylate isomerase
MTISIDYFFSTSSPWTYLGSKRFTEMASQVGATVHCHPVNYGKIFPVSGGLPLPKRAPQRRAYRLLELDRWKKRTGLPLVLEPRNFPSTDPITALTLIAARNAGHDILALSNAVLAALWEQDRNIDDPATVAAICNECGLDGNALTETALKPETMAQFDANSEAAILRGVFGAPTYIIDEELFWGQDRLDFVSEKLGLS